MKISFFIPDIYCSRLWDKIQDTIAQDPDQNTRNKTGKIKKWGIVSQCRKTYQQTGGYKLPQVVADTAGSTDTDRGQGGFSFYKSHNKQT